jgi:hypothetical protein
VRLNIVNAAESTNITNSARFGAGTKMPFDTKTIGEDGLNALFNATVPATNKISYQCFDMAQVFWARGIQVTLNPTGEDKNKGEFDARE